MDSLSEAPRLCWAWCDVGRKTSPSLQWIREIIDGSGIGVNGYTWICVQPIEDGHPEPSKEAALRANYMAQEATGIDETTRAAIRSVGPRFLVPSGPGPTAPWPKRLASTLTAETPQQSPSALSRIWARIRGWRG